MVSSQETSDDHLHLMRERQRMYLGPIAAARLAHIGVTLYRSAKTPFQKRLIVGGIVGSTVVAIGMRLVLLVHSGYPGGVNPNVPEREIWVSASERKSIQDPRLVAIAKEASRSFG